MQDRAETATSLTLSFLVVQLTAVLRMMIVLVMLKVMEKYRNLYHWLTHGVDQGARAEKGSRRQGRELKPARCNHLHPKCPSATEATTCSDESSIIT